MTSRITRRQIVDPVEGCILAELIPCKVNDDPARAPGQWCNPNTGTGDGFCRDADGEDVAVTAAPDVVWWALTDAEALTARGLLTTIAAKVGHQL